MASGQSSSEETLQRRRAVGDTVSGLTDRGTEPRPPASIAMPKQLSSSVGNKPKQQLIFFISVKLPQMLLYFVAYLSSYHENAINALYELA